MSFPIRTRRLLSSAGSLGVAAPGVKSLVAHMQRRTAFISKRVEKDAHENPLTDEYTKRKPPPRLARGDLASSSIFEDEEVAGAKVEPPESDGVISLPRNPDIMAAALDPDPSSRLRWERKMVIREIHRRGRLTKSQIIKRTEREIVSKSHNIKTSVKKLGPLARQISGKSVEDAIIQMRFSKKKAAADVKAHLEHARNEAIVRRGMGLGPLEGKKIAPTVIRTKEGKLIKIEDPTSLYVAQAWVGKGDYGISPDHRARGRVYIMKNPSTHIAVVLKEEATRIREHEERVQKVKNRRVWTQLPNRPITSQRQYYSW